MIDKKLTIYDIAELSGVSPSTVSRVINNSGYVAKDKRDRVMKVIEEHEYKPNALAQGLSTRHSQTIGMLVPDAINPFFATVFVTLEKEAAKYDYNVILCNFSNDNVETLKQIAMLQTKQVDVIVQLGGPTDLEDLPVEYKESLLKGAAGIPIITNGNSGDGAFISVSIDDSLAIEHMIRDAYGLGHRRFAMLGGNSRFLPTGLKQKAFRNAVKAMGLPAENAIVIDYDKYDQFGGEQCVEILERRHGDNLPTMLIGINEFVAIGVWQALMKKGYRIPEDISIAGFDNTYLASFCMPRLTSIGCDYEEYAKRMMGIILAVLDGKVDGKVADVLSHYVRGASIGSVR
ncbi:MAG: LacI family transcriptional regulator [Lachnospiraceae bacterium]|nr:LacI family transcriptional regulator [Lachnospiraceae bacterium]